MYSICVSLASDGIHFSAGDSLPVLYRFLNDQTVIEIRVACFSPVCALLYRYVIFLSCNAANVDVTSHYGEDEAFAAT